MSLELDDKTQRFIREHRVARLATADAGGRPSVIPICYVFDGSAIYSPLDEKPKSVDATRLKRIQNVKTNRQVSLVIDDYSEDWSRLAYALIGGVAEVIEPQQSEHARAVELLRAKYAQYGAMAIDGNPMIKITPTRVKLWGRV